MRGELKYASTMNGVQFVIVVGTSLMLKWSADNLDSIHEVHILMISHANYYILLSLLFSMQTGVWAYSSSYFGQGVGKIHLTYVACTGTESELLNCRYRTPSRISCNHYEDAGVRCPGIMHSMRRNIAR